MRKRNRAIAYMLYVVVCAVHEKSIQETIVVKFIVISEPLVMCISAMGEKFTAS